MWFTSWLRVFGSNRSARRPAHPAPRATRSRPQLEVLEDRCLPSAMPVPSTLTVTNNLDNGSKGSLRYEIAQAQSGDTIVFNFDKKVVGRTINLDGSELYINKNLTIQGPSDPVTISGGGSSRVFEVAPNVTAALSGLTITNGFSDSGSNASDYPNDGGGILNLGTLTVSGCTLFGNTASFPDSPPDGSGGGICNFGTLTVSDSTVGLATPSNGGAFTGNTAGEGGGICNFGTLTVNNSTLDNNGAHTGDGGGIFNGGTLTVSNSTLDNNGASNPDGYSRGGGLCNYFGSTAYVAASTLSGNGGDDGGGIFNGGNLTVSNSTLSGNVSGIDDIAQYYGGGIFNGGNLTVSNSTLSHNTAPDGGGIYNDGGTVTVSNSTLEDNSAYFGIVWGYNYYYTYGGYGGGIYNNGGTVTVNGASALTGNFADYAGGGIYNYAGTLMVSDAAVSGNSAADNGVGYGGGIYNDGGTATVSNGSTVSGNSAASEGGGIYNNAAASAVTVSDTVFSGNLPDTIYGFYTDGGGNTFG